MNTKAKGFKFDWEGCLSDIKEKFSSVELQHRSSEWRWCFLDDKKLLCKPAYNLKLL